MQPKARDEGLVFIRLADETLIYDLERHRALCLNRVAAAIWHRCDGRTSISELASGVSRELTATVDDEVIWFALSRLAKAHVLKDGLPSFRDEPGLARRDVLRRLAGAGALAVGLPAVLSVVAPTALQAQGSCAGQGESCAVLPCCPGLLCNPGRRCRPL